ncbi:MAG: hypothetical protein ACI9T8_000410 [Candidatus Saccharimonadales bacterium]|jgi:hypothetical protein
MIKSHTPESAPGNPNIVAVPYTYFNSSEPSFFGRRRRYDARNIVEINGKSALAEDIESDSSNQLATSLLLLPEHIVPRLEEYADELAAGGVSQEGLYTGQGEVVRNCASFVSAMAGVEFDHRLLNDTANFNGWTPEERGPDYQPEPGEFVIYAKPEPQKWMHWGVGVGGDVPGVIGLGGPNGHGLTISSSPDLAVLAMGHKTTHTAHHPQIAA